MITFTTLDSTGEPLSTFQVPDEAHVSANLMEGQAYVIGSNPPDSYYLNDQWVVKPSRPSSKHVWNKITKQWEDPRTIEQIKLEKRAEINQAREAEFDAPLVTPHGTFDSDPKARTSITDAVLLAQTLQSLGTPTTIDFTLYDNSTVTLDTAGMITVGLMLGQKIQAAHAKSRALKAQIEAATTKEQIDAIKWPTPPETP